MKDTSKIKLLKKDIVSPTITAYPDKVIQFGGGNFLRGFVDWMIDILNEQTDFQARVIIIKPTKDGDYETLRSQDGLFHVVLNGVENGKPVETRRLVKSVSHIIHPYNEWNAYLATAENPNIRFIISNTTEAGIIFNEKDIIKKNECPKEFPAKLTLWLYHRFQFFKGASDKGCVILPLELIKDNGKILKDCVGKYAGHFGLGSEFYNWLHDHNFYCNSLVDRIISGYPEKDANRLTKEIGYQDKIIVAGEAYHSWIIEAPDFVRRELPFSLTDLNVKFVADLDIHRQIKVKILNGAHTAMVPISLLAGLKYVSDVMQDPIISKFLEQMIYEEVIPTINYPKSDLEEFASSVFERFRNTKMQHKLSSIALNSTAKYITRLNHTLLDYLDLNGHLPRRISFAFAALIRFYKGEIDQRELPVNDKPEIIQFFQESWKAHNNDIEKLALKILSNIEIWNQDLNKIPGLAELVIHQLSEINSKGIKLALKQLDTEQ